MKIFFGGIVMAKEKDFLTLYSKVFALDGKISACGRNACLDLIHKCCELGDVNANYGSTDDDVKNLIALMTTLDIASVPFDGNE